MKKIIKKKYKAPLSLPVEIRGVEALADNMYAYSGTEIRDDLNYYTDESADPSEALGKTNNLWEDLD